MMNYHNSSIEANANRAAKMADAENHRLVVEARNNITFVRSRASVGKLILVTATRITTLVAAK